MATKKSYSVTLQSQCAIKWVHDLVPLASNPADTPFIRNIIEAGKRSPRTTSSKKEPISIDTLDKIVAKYTTPDSELKDLRTALLSVLGFFGLFRASELTNIKAKDITVNPDHLIIFVPTSKTDQYRNGNQVFIAQTNGHLCPHALLLRYFSLASSIHSDSDEYIFRSLQASRRGTTATALASKRLSYTRLREIIKETISSIGLDPKQYSTHSLRSGGASFMANSQGNNPNLNRLLKLQGRWKSDTSKDMYAKDSIFRKSIDFNKDITYYRK
jgi:integrase